MEKNGRGEKEGKEKEIKEGEGRKKRKWIEREFWPAHFSHASAAYAVAAQ